MAHGSIVRSKKLRDSARGETCTFQIVDVCNGNPETTVLCHLPLAGGIGFKSSDISSGYGCSDCHSVVDGHTWSQEYLDHAHFYNRRAQARTLERMHQTGLIIIKGAK